MRLVVITFAAFFIAAVSTVNADESKGQGQAPTIAADSATDDYDDNRTLTIELVSSTTSSITIRWTVRNVSASVNRPPTGSSGDENSKASTTFIVQATSMSTKMKLISPPINGANSTTFTLPELAVDSAYDVCVMRSPEESACAIMRTIPTVRLDSVLALIIVIAFIIMLILIAVVCWRCAIFCASRTETPSQEPSVADEKVATVTANTPGENNIGDEKEPLLVTSGSPGQSPDSDQQQPASLYLYMTGPALDYK